MLFRSLDYSGTLFLVSHDRAFLDNVVTSVIAFEGDGKWQEYAGGYQDWARCRAAASSKPEKKSAEAPKTKPAAEKPAAKVKLSFKETRELETLPGQIEALEQEQREIGEKLSDGELYRTNPKEATRLQARHAEIDDVLLVSLARWEELEAKR